MDAEVIRQRYFSSAEEFSNLLAKKLGSALKAIVGFGGLARSNGIFENWSDIDVLVIVGESTAANLFAVSNVRRATFRDIGISSTVAVITELDVLSRFMLTSPSNSVILNALSGRSETGVLLRGHAEFRIPDLSLEKQNAASYIVDTAIGMRRFVSATNWEERVDGSSMARLIKWTASLMRAALRLEGIFVLPYEPSIEPLKDIYRLLEWERIEKIFAWRTEWNVVSNYLGPDDLMGLLNFIESLRRSISERHGQFTGP